MRPNIFITAGHSTKSPGALGYDGIVEHTRNTYLQKLIVEDKKSFISYEGTSINTISDEDTQTLSQVISLINKNSTPKSRGLDIHFNNNNPAATGTEIIISPLTSEENKRRATFMVRNISNLLDLRIRRRADDRDYMYPEETPRGKLAIINNTKIPYILYEVCFLNNRDLPKYIGKEKEVATILREAMAKFSFTDIGSENQISSVFVQKFKL